MKAASRPTSTVIAPPTEAPIASMTAHVAADKALAVIRDSRGTTSGSMAVRAGSKNAVAMTPSVTSTNASQI